MHRNITAILSLTVAAVIVSFLATNSMMPTTFLVASNQPQVTTNDETKVLGHVVYEIKDANGNLKSYMQTDNIRVNQGLSCAASYLFKNSTSGNTANCPWVANSGAGTTGFQYVGLINGTFSTSATHTRSVLGTASSGVGGVLNTANQGGPPTAGTVTFPAFNSVQIASPAFAFTSDATAGTTVTGSALFNSASSTTANEFAENTMSVAVGNADTLTVTWTITFS